MGPPPASPMAAWALGREQAGDLISTSSRLRSQPLRTWRTCSGSETHLALGLGHGFVPRVCASPVCHPGSSVWVCSSSSTLSPAPRPCWPALECPMAWPCPGAVCRSPQPGMLHPAQLCSFMGPRRECWTLEPERGVRGGSSLLCCLPFSGTMACVEVANF